MTKRLRKKLHRRFVDHAVDISQISLWRKRLFGAEEGQEFPLDMNHLDGVGDFLAGFIRRHRLSYTVARVAPADAPEWACEAGLIPFRIRSREFPEVRTYSGNNPDVV